jgi:hypothetical protein
MKIHELFTESDLQEVTRPSLTQAHRRLHQAGYFKLGEGYFASVFYREGESSVLKLFSNRDLGYIDFIRLVGENPNAHFPKFSRRAKAIKITDGYSAIRMEFLKPLPASTTYGSSRQLGDIVYQYILKLKHGKIAPDDVVEIDPKIDIEQFMLELERKQPGFIQACKLIANFTRSDSNIDISEENIMLRGGTLVITDPLS